MILNLLIVLGVVLADQLSKQIVLMSFENIGDTFPIIKDVLHLTYITNDGAAFGMLDDARWLFLAVSAIVIAVLPFAIHAFRRDGLLVRLALCFILGGGIGNMIDRLFYRGGEVVDFIDFRLINFAIFNVADSFVTVGSVMLVLYFIISEIKTFRRKKEEQI